MSVALYLWAGADSVMQFNEVYGGPNNEFDGTPWDLEYTNFNVTYQFNYSHDNAAGWMSYMGNSSNSVARYNLSVNDNGVLVKNMLSTNYSPTYFTNNTFVYDGADLDYFHDETFLSQGLLPEQHLLQHLDDDTDAVVPPDRRAAASRCSRTTTTTRRAARTPARNRPTRTRVRAHPRFVGDPADYVTGLGVDRIRKSAEHFRLRDDSPLIDAGRYNAHLGTEDFLGTHLYYGDAPDIGIAESRNGEQVTDPVDNDPIEEEPGQPGQPRAGQTGHRELDPPRRRRHARRGEADRRRPDDPLGRGRRRGLPDHARHRLRRGHHLRRGVPGRVHRLGHQPAGAVVRAATMGRRCRRVGDVRRRATTASGTT